MGNEFEDTNFYPALSLLIDRVSRWQGRVGAYAGKRRIAKAIDPSPLYSEEGSINHILQGCIGLEVPFHLTSTAVQPGATAGLSGAALYSPGAY